MSCLRRPMCAITFSKPLRFRNSEKFVIRPQGSYKQIVFDPDKADDLRRELGIAIELEACDRSRVRRYAQGL